MISTVYIINPHYQFYLKLTINMKTDEEKWYEFWSVAGRLQLSLLIGFVVGALFALFINKI